MGLLGLILGFGKSREAKMAIWMLEHTQKHIGGMIGKSSEFWEACRLFPERKAEIENMTGAAFITYFFACLSPEVTDAQLQETITAFSFHTSIDMRNLIDGCVRRIGQSFNDAKVAEISRPVCAKWLYERMQNCGIIPRDNSVLEEREFTNGFMNECLAIRAEAISFKAKFLQ